MLFVYGGELVVAVAGVARGNFKYEVLLFLFLSCGELVKIKLNPFSTAAPFWGRTTPDLSSLSPKRLRHKRASRYDVLLSSNISIISYSVILFTFS